MGNLTGDVRLEIDTDLRIVPAAYVRGADGALSAMHDTVQTRAAPRGGYEYLVPIFYPSTEMTLVSRLRLINPGEAVASATIEGRDDHGTAATGGAVQLRLEAAAATALTAQQLRAGNASFIGLTGRLGAGVGKWRLTVSSDEPIQVVNVVSSTSGFVNNLSTTGIAGLAPRDHEAFNGRFADSGIEYRSFSVDFRDGPQGFVADFADLPATDTAIYELMSGFGPLPSPLGPDEALFISGHNRSDDLFMFFRGQVGGLVPGARYNATVSVEIATDTPFGCVRTQEE